MSKSPERGEKKNVKFKDQAGKDKKQQPSPKC